MCLLLKEKFPSNKDEIGFFPCVATHAAPLPASERPQLGAGRRPPSLCLPRDAAGLRGCWMRGDGHGGWWTSQLFIPCATLGPSNVTSFRLMGSRSCWGWRRTAQPQLPSPPAGVPCISGSPCVTSPVPAHQAACEAGGCLSSWVSCGAVSPAAQLWQGDRWRA